MRVYRCPKCGREVELPEGDYYCKVCGPSAVMVRVVGDSFEGAFKSILYFERLPRARDVQEVIKELTSLNFSRWWDLINKYGIFQFWNLEYIWCLAIEIKKRVDIGLVLEVAAGDGMLSFWLGKHNVNVKATDSGEWYDKVKRRAPVEIIDAVSAIKKYKPKMVIASWLPVSKTLDIEIFNACAEMRVPYIILIGETDGACGSLRFWEEKYWRKVGYEEEYLNRCDEYNWCRTDYYAGNWFRHSSTILFTLKSGYQ